jgi:hypothetical protein
MPGLSFAIPTMEPRLRDHEIRIGLQASDYLNPSLEPVGDAGTGDAALTVGVRGVGEHNDIHMAVEGESLLGLKRTSYHYLDVGELYIGYDQKSQPNAFYAYLGRKRFEWSALDSYWSLGLFAPRFRWDYLNERENGLFGFFPGYRGEYFELTAFVSPIFIPEQGAPFDFNGGDCHSSSPWFSCPASTISIFNQPTNVNFTLNVPPVSDLIVHEGHGATLRVGGKEGPFGRFSWAHKPMNQFLLAFQGQLNLANSSVPAVIIPRVIYHDLWSLDLGLKGEKGDGVTASALYEHPIRDSTPSNWNTQEVSDARLYSATAIAHPLSVSKLTRLEASYFHRGGGIAPDQGPFVDPTTSYFEPRYAFQNAFSVAAFTPIKDDWGRKFLLSTKFIVDTVYTGNLLVFDLFYSPLPHLVTNLGFDWLGSNNPNAVDFLSRYQRNSRVRGGAFYSF